MVDSLALESANLHADSRASYRLSTIDYELERDALQGRALRGGGQRGGGGRRGSRSRARTPGRAAPQGGQGARADVLPLAPLQQRSGQLGGEVRGRPDQAGPPAPRHLAGGGVLHLADELHAVGSL